MHDEFFDFIGKTYLGMHWPQVKQLIAVYFRPCTGFTIGVASSSSFSDRRSCARTSGRQGSTRELLDRLSFQ